MRKNYLKNMATKSKSSKPKAKAKSATTPEAKLRALRAKSKSQPAPTKTTVQIIESERGWGQKVDETLVFDKVEDAKEYVRLYNELYNPPCADTPDWYMVAVLK